MNEQIEKMIQSISKIATIMIFDVRYIVWSMDYIKWRYNK